MHEWKFFVFLFAVAVIYFSSFIYGFNWILTQLNVSLKYLTNNFLHISLSLALKISLVIRVAYKCWTELKIRHMLLTVCVSLFFERRFFHRKSIFWISKLKAIPGPISFLLEVIAYGLAPLHSLSEVFVRISFILEGVGEAVSFWNSKF